MSHETSTFRVVEDEAELRTVHQEFAAAFCAGAEEVRRAVNFPGPSPGYPNAALAWHPLLGVWGFFPDEPRLGRGGERVRYCSFFGTDLQGSSVAPVVEINLGAHRHPTGRAFRDEAGQLYIGHRGRLGGGRANVDTQRFHKEAAASGFALVTVVRSAGARDDAILVGRIAPESLAKDIARFVHFCAGLRDGAPSEMSKHRASAAVTDFPRITRDPAVMGGKACIRGMRVTVGMILGNLGAGVTIERLLELYPYLEREDVLEALRYGAWLASEREIRLEAA